MSEHELPPERQEKAARIQALQRQVAGRLIVGGLVFGLLVLGAAYLSIVPRGRLQPAAAEPVLEAYLISGRERSLWGIHRLYSKRGLRENDRQAVFLDLEQRGLFQPYRSLEIVEFETWPSGAGIEDLSHEARVVARVVYEDGGMARMEASLDLEQDEWRIRDLSLGRP